jgi:hypothetical protein
VRRAVIGLLALAALLGASCGGGSGGSDGRGERDGPAPEATAPDAPPTTVDSPDDLAVPRDPGEAADILARVEPALRSDATSPADIPRLAWEQQNAYRALGAQPDWLSAVLAAVPPDLHTIVAANEAAGRSIAVLNQPQPDLPAWRIEAPLPAEVLIGYYREAEAASGVPWPYLAAIHVVETRVGRIRGTSSAGAQGPMQFIPETWAAYGEGDINDNRDAILAAGRYLDARGGPEDMDRALFAYNNDDQYVTAIQAYAGLIAADERAYRGYYHWQVYYATTDGVSLLPEGYPDRPAIRTEGAASR